MKVGLIGTGLMGKPMSQKIKNSGFDIIVFNRTIEKAKELEIYGIEVSHSSTKLIESVDVVITMLSDYNAIINSFFLEKISFNNKTVIQMSTISPKESILLKERINKLGGYYFEAPVLGSLQQIEEKKLVVLVGGTEDDKNKYEKLFESFSNRIVYIGEVGKAAAVKLSLNQLIATETAAFSMSLGYLRENKVNINTFMDILRSSALYAPTFDKKLPNFLERNFENPNFPLKHLLKDVSLMISQFKQDGISTLPLEAVEEIIRKGIENNLSEKDYSSLYNVIHPGAK